MSVTLTFTCDRRDCDQTAILDVQEPSRMLSAYVPQGWCAFKPTRSGRYAWVCPSHAADEPYDKYNPPLFGHEGDGQ